MNLGKGILPDHMQLRKLLLQSAKLCKHPMNIAAGRQKKLIGQDRLQKRIGRPLLKAQTVASPCLCKTCQRTDHSGRSFRDCPKTLTGIKADLIHLFLPCLFFPASRKKRFDLQASSGDLKMGQPVSLCIPADLIYPGSKFRRIFLI